MLLLAGYLLAFVFTAAVAAGGILYVRHQDQKPMKIYDVTCPSNMKPEKMLDFIGSLSTKPQTRGWHFVGVEPIVFELVSTDRGIKQRLRLPTRTAQHILPRLRNHIRGVRADEVPNDLPTAWTISSELAISSRTRPLRLTTPEAICSNLLSSVQVGTDETLVIQWVVTPANPAHKPGADEHVKTDQLVRAAFGMSAKKDEVQERRAKMDYPNFMAILRVGVLAADKSRANEIMEGVKSAYASVATADANFHERRTPPSNLTNALAPHTFPTAVNSLELASLVGWPFEGVIVPGMATAKARHLQVPAWVPKEGLVIGYSNMQGDERPVAITTYGSTMHTYISGPTGSGKTVAGGNLFTQAIASGAGGAVIETKGEKNDFYHTVLNQIPRHRAQDVIVIDLADPDYAVGWNILEHGDPQTVAGGLESLMTAIYGDTALTVPAALYHGLMVFMTSTNITTPMTIADLPLLYSPTSKDELDYGKHLIAGVPERQIRDWWQAIDDQNPTLQKRNAFFKPMGNRLWQINSRRQLRNIIGQSRSTINIQKAIAENKILLFNLTSLSDQVRDLAGAMAIEEIWRGIKAAKGNRDRPFYLAIDEFQNYPNLALNSNQMLAEGRAFKLALILANQSINDLGGRVSSAVMTNCRNKIIYQTDEVSASKFAGDFGRKLVAVEDITGLENYEAICRVVSEIGVSPPVTVKMAPPMPDTGLADYVRAYSRAKYSRPVAQVEAEIDARRNITLPKRPRPKLGPQPV